jgi:methionyl-tRNA formyltransferase
MRKDIYIPSAMKKSLRVLFFGNERIATGITAHPVVFESLVASHHEVVGLVVHLRPGTGRRQRSEPIVELARRHAIPVLNPEKLKEAIDELKEFKADCGVLVAYGKIIPQEVIDVFPHGILNIHPSLLPKLRGSTPIETALLQGVSETGVSIMSLSKEMDAGPVYSQQSLGITPDESKAGLASKLQLLGKDMLVEILDLIAEGTASATPQAHAEATTTSQIAKEDGLLDFSKPATKLIDEIRAFSGWPGSYFTHADQTYVVIDAKASSVDVSDRGGSIVVDKATLRIQTSDGSLSIERIQPAGKKEMPIQAFLNGYRDRF